MAKKRYAGRNVDGELYLRTIDTKNSTQKYYVDMLRESTITFCSGPAGTGKTFLATYVALEALLDKAVDKIVLTRPIVATEDIGYLPGDMNEKIHPYLMPLIDAIEIHMGPTKSRELLESGRIEVHPLAYMRGRSLNRSFLILDEAQNTTKEQMKMFLTRIGYDSKIVCNGDASQTDLPKTIWNGLSWGIEKLKGADKDISVIEFSASNIVRHPLIEKVLRYLDGPAQKVEKLEQPRIAAVLA